MPPRLDEIEIPKPRPELDAPFGFVYLSWSGGDFACLSVDQETTLCGQETPPRRLITANPLGKPRCRDCLKAAEIEPLPNEPKLHRRLLPELLPNSEPQQTPEGVDKKIVRHDLPQGFGKKSS